MCMCGGQDNLGVSFFYCGGHGNKIQDSVVSRHLHQQSHLTPSTLFHFKSQAVGVWYVCVCARACLPACLPVFT